MNMRYQDAQQRFEAIKQYLGQLEQSIRLDSTGKEIRLLAFQKALAKKNLISEQDMTEAISEVMEEMRKQAEEMQTKLATPTTEQVQAVTESTEQNKQ